MNKDRFFKLLNLYLDDDIGPSDLRDLMTETRRDSARQQIFLDYCRIHKAVSRITPSLASRPGRRTFTQTLYALGGLAAAIALLGMAGRNLMPYVGGDSMKTDLAQQVEQPLLQPFSPEFAANELSVSQFLFENSASTIEPFRVSNLSVDTSGRSKKWPNVLFLSQNRNILNLKREPLFLDEFTGVDAMELNERFDAFGESGSIEFSSAASFPPASSFTSSVGRDSRLNLK